MMAIFFLFELEPLEDELEPPLELAPEAELLLELEPHAAINATTVAPTARVATHRKRDLLILTPFKFGAPSNTRRRRHIAVPSRCRQLVAELGCTRALVMPRPGPEDAQVCGRFLCPKKTLQVVGATCQLNLALLGRRLTGRKTD